jgi:hypothetical protein
MVETTTNMLLDVCSGDGCPDLINCDTSLLADNITNSFFNYTLCSINSSSTEPNVDSPKTEWMDPSYYSMPYRIIGTIFQGIILIVGKLTIFRFQTKSIQTLKNYFNIIFHNFWVSFDLVLYLT